MSLFLLLKTVIPQVHELSCNIYSNILDQACMSDDVFSLINVCSIISTLIELYTNTTPAAGV